MGGRLHQGGTDRAPVWWVVFNHPEHCADPFDPGFECGAGDLFAPGVDASVRCAAANVVGRSVRAGFGARPRTGDDREALTGLGLTNPTQAEIHAVVRTHGPDIPELVHEQIRSCLASPAVASPASPRRRDGPPVRGGGGWAPSPTSGTAWKG
jgi:hypothetical protein